MKNILLDMLKEAERLEDYELIGYVKRIISELAQTINAPSDWREIGKDLLNEYDEGSWVYEELELWNH